MKKVRFIALALVIVLASALFLSCSAKEEVEVTANVKVVDGDGETILDTAVLIKSSNPTVLLAITQACQESNINIEDDGDDVKSIAGIGESEDDENLYFWDCTIDRKGIETKASKSVLTNDKEHNIVYTYASVEKTVTDDEGNIVTDETTKKK